MPIELLRSIVQPITLPRLGGGAAWRSAQSWAGTGEKLRGSLFPFIKRWINRCEGKQPMSEMVERVARAIAFERDWETLEEASRAVFRDQARSAIEALRHRPTPNVIHAGAVALGFPGICLDGSSPSYRHEANMAWEAMLDAALGESIREAE
jgi:hypothetical protein